MALVTIAQNGKIPMTVVRINVKCELIEANIETNRAIMRAIDRPDGGSIDVAFSDFVGDTDRGRLTDEFSTIILASCPTMTTVAALAMVAKLVARVAM
jgi:hypothetical protein